MFGRQSLNSQSVVVVMSLSAVTDLVFGLDWTPLLGGLPEKLGQQRARAARASHFVVMGSLAAVVGYGVIRPKPSEDQGNRSDRLRPHYSAAAVFALAHPEGVVAAIYFIPDKGYWFVAVNTGLVLAQTDRWYATIEQADAALVALKDRFPAIQVLPFQDLDQANPPEWMLKHISPQARLLKITRHNRRLIQLTCVALCVSLSGWLWLDSQTQQPLSLAEDDSNARWQQVFERFANMHPVHHSDHLLKVISSWRQAPLSPGGWQLRQIVCEPSGMDWHCAARYLRIKKLAMSEQLDAIKPEGWVAEFSDFDQGILRWKVLEAASAFEPVSRAMPFKTWLSYLQSVTPVFQSIEIGSGSTVILQAPLTEMGVALSRPASIQPLKRRMLAIKGPLRSMSALKGLSVTVRWRSIQLELGLTAGQGISRSELIVSLNGEVFEISE